MLLEAEQQPNKNQLEERGRDFIWIPLGVNENHLRLLKYLRPQKSDSKVLVKRRELLLPVLITFASFDRLMEHEAPDSRLAIKFLPLFCFPP